MDAAGAADVLIDGGTPFVVDAAGAADLGVQPDAGVDLGRACAEYSAFVVSVFRSKQWAWPAPVRSRSAIGFAFQVDVAATGDFGGDMGSIDLHFHITGAADMHFRGFRGC